jgi:hypothetical protein
LAASGDERYNTLYNSCKMQSENVKGEQLGELEADGRKYKYVTLKLCSYLSSKRKGQVRDIFLSCPTTALFRFCDHTF